MKIVKIALVSIIITLAFSPLCQVQAAGPPQPKPPTDPGCWPPPCVPIDGGISFLVAAGVGLAAKKLYDSRKK